MLALSIRRDRTAAVLRKLAKMESDARIARRILAIANALDGRAETRRRSRRAWTAKRCATRSSATTSMALTGSPTGSVTGGHRNSTPRRKPSSFASCSLAPIRRRAAFRRSRARI